MRVVVVGAGVVGVTTAHYLARAGHRVTVVDKESDVAMGTSKANAAQLSYSFGDAMASPKFAAGIPRLLAGADPAILIRPQLDLAFLRWGFSLLGQCRSAKAKSNTTMALQLAVRSARLLAELRASLPDNFSFRAAGKIVLLRTCQQVDDAAAAATLKAEIGCPAEVISMHDAINIEPAIAAMNGNYLAAVHAPGDEVGDAQAFSRTLAAELVRGGACEFLMSTAVDNIVVEQNKVRGLRTNGGDVDAEAVIVCAGIWSHSLLDPLGIDPGIYPVRGYSLTLPATGHSPVVSLTDLGKRFVISRLDYGIRIAGFADFVGMNQSRDAARIRDLLAVARQHAPLAANYETDDPKGWGGFRPTTASGYPQIGPTGVAGLYLNTGHGSLGWTFACASASDVAGMIGQ